MKGYQSFGLFMLCAWMSIASTFANSLESLTVNPPSELNLERESDLGQNLNSDERFLSVNGQINDNYFAFQGDDRRDIEEQCLHFGKIHWIYRVDSLLIHGMRVWVPTRQINEACSKIAEHAH